jgi:hypothetical protein
MKIKDDGSCFTAFHGIISGDDYPFYFCILQISIIVILVIHLILGNAKGFL